MITKNIWQRQLQETRHVNKSLWRTIKRLKQWFRYKQRILVVDAMIGRRNGHRCKIPKVRTNLMLLKWYPVLVLYHTDSGKMFQVVVKPLWYWLLAKSDEHEITTINIEGGDRISPWLAYLSLADPDLPRSRRDGIFSQIRWLKNEC